MVSWSDIIVKVAGYAIRMEIQRIINSHEFLEFRKEIVDTVMSKAPLLYLHDEKGPLSEPGDSGSGVFFPWSTIQWLEVDWAAGVHD